jgi:hypothetical protein
MFLRRGASHATAGVADLVRRRKAHAMRVVTLR